MSSLFQAIFYLTGEVGEAGELSLAQLQLSSYLPGAAGAQLTQHRHQLSHGLVAVRDHRDHSLRHLGFKL
jgi:hypothetical protein